MGSGQSARKLTISNEENAGVIKVSNAVVQRLAQGGDVPATETAQEVRPATPVPPAATKVKPQPPPSPPPSGDLHSGYPVYYYPELTLTALQIQQQKEQELQSQDVYWQKRLQNLERNHSKINRIMEDEYRKAKNELYSTGKKATNLQETIQPCSESSAKVLKCYEEYPREILKCSSLVEEFSNCVDQRRARVIAARC